MKKLRDYGSTTTSDSFETQLNRMDFIYQEICLYRALKAKMDKQHYLPSYLLDALDEKKQFLQQLLDPEERLHE